jgi:hypothetical protein
MQKTERGCLSCPSRYLLYFPRRLRDLKRNDVVEIRALLCAIS